MTDAPSSVDHRVHAAVKVVEYAGKGIVVWCNCGVGSPPKPTVDEANASIAEHIADPQVLPR